MRGNYLDAAPFAQERVARIAVVARSPTSRASSGRKRASRVAGGRCDSYGEALATCMARGRRWRSQIAMILLPLPRRVGPTAAPLFRPDEGGVNEGFGEIDLAAVAQI